MIRQPRRFDKSPKLRHVEVFARRLVGFWYNAHVSWRRRVFSVGIPASGFTGLSKEGLFYFCGSAFVAGVTPFFLRIALSAKKITAEEMSTAMRTEQKVHMLKNGSMERP